MKSFLSILIVASLALSAIGTAAAQDRNAGQLNADQVKARIEAAGYTNVQNVRREGDHFDAKATDKNGKRVSLDVDAKTGAVTPEKEGEDEAREHNR